MGQVGLCIGGDYDEVFSVDEHILPLDSGSDHVNSPLESSRGIAKAEGKTGTLVRPTVEGERRLGPIVLGYGEFASTLHCSTTWRRPGHSLRSRGSRPSGLTDASRVLCARSTTDI